MMRIRMNQMASIAIATILLSNGCSDSRPVTDGPEGAVSRAPPLDPTRAVSLYDSVRFLYEGDALGQAAQSHASPASFTRSRTAVVRGRVTDENGAPLAGAQVSVPSHPEWGTATT